MNDGEILEFTEKIQLSNDCMISVGERKIPNHLIIEAPLGRKYGVIDIFIDYPDFCLLCEVKPDKYEKVEKRLQKQIPNYLKAILDAKENPNSKSRLIYLIRNAIAKKDTYLVCITNDRSFPHDLRCFLKEFNSDGRIMTGWIDYSIIERILNRYGYSKKGMSSHIWVTKHENEE
jgi:hypothetical protein